MLFHFMDEQLQFKNIDEAITQAKSMTNIKHDWHDKENGKDYRSCHAKGVGDRSRDKEQQEHAK